MSLLSRLPLHPLLLAAFAILSVYAGNLTEVLPVDLGGPLGPLGRSVLGAAAVLGVCSLLLRDWRRGAIVATALVAAYAFFGHSRRPCWTSACPRSVQMGAWALLVVVAVVFAIRARGALTTATLTLNVFTLILVGLSLLTIVPYESSRVMAQADRRPRSPASHHRDQGPEQGYLPHRPRPVRLRMVARAPVRDHRQRPARWLPTRVPGGARGARELSGHRLLPVLDAQHADARRPDDERSAPSPTTGHLRGDRLVRPEVGAFLKDNGYRYYQLGSWYGPTQTNQHADASRPMTRRPTARRSSARSARRSSGR